MLVSQQNATPTILALVGYSNHILRQTLDRVTFPLSKRDQEIIANMKYSIQPEQLKQAKAPFPGAAGMAANQWGLNRQIFLFCPNGNASGDIEVVINPSYIPIANATSSLTENDLAWEGCFSIPLSTGQIKRYKHIQVTYQNESGTVITKELYDWPARVWQHENDHLNGILYEDPAAQKCVDFKQFKSAEALQEFYKTNKSVTDPRPTV